MATVTWTGSGANNLASTILNWDTGTAPTTGDAVVLDGAFPVTGNKNCTWDITATILSINSTGYSGVITASATMTLSLGITFAANTFAHGNQEVILNGSSNRSISTGSTNPFYKLTFSESSATINTLSTDVYVSNQLDLNSTFANITYNSNKFYVSGSLTQSNTSGGTPDGTTVVELSETGTWSQAYSSDQGYRFEMDVIINTAGTITISGTIIFAGNFTYTAGTVVTTSSTFQKTKSTNFNSGAISWNNLTLASTFNIASATTTLTGNLTVGGTLTINSSQTLSAGNKTITLSGNFTNNGTFTRATSTVIFNG